MELEIGAGHETVVVEVRELLQRLKEMHRREAKASGMEKQQDVELDLVSWECFKQVLKFSNSS